LPPSTVMMDEAGSYQLLTHFSPLTTCYIFKVNVTKIS